MAGIRVYDPADEEGWLRCRALGFLHTAYFDDVLTSKPSYEGAPVELVAVDQRSVVGVLDIAIERAAATIETVAVHPDHQRSGIASALLDEALRLLPREVETLDAWTRDDEAANGWYRSRGFEEAFRYLHVYARDEEADRAVERARTGLTPVAGFFHAAASAEDEMRAAFKRVHVCRQYVRACRVEDAGPQPTPR